MLRRPRYSSRLCQPKQDLVQQRSGLPPTRPIEAHSCCVQSFPAPAPDTIQRVLGFVPAVNGNTAMTFNYKLFVNGTFVSGGPSRGEAKIWDGDGAFRVPATSTEPKVGGAIE